MANVVWGAYTLKRSTTMRARLRRAWHRLNDLVEFCCVHALRYCDVLCASLFVIGYGAMVFSTFKGAPWNDPDFDCY